MRRLLFSATILLCIQIGLVVAVTNQNKSFEPYIPQTKLADFDPVDIDSVLLSGRDEGTLAFSKSEDGWYITSPAAIAADSVKVADFIEKLSGLKRGLAIATSKNAAKRLQVSTEDYRYHVLLKQNHEVQADYYFGTSPGYKQLHARTAGTDEIVTAALASYEISPLVKDWLNQTLLHLEQEHVAKIVFDYMTLQRSDDDWLVSDGDNEADADSDAVTVLLESICNLKIKDINTEAVHENREQDLEKLEFSVDLDNGASLAYSVIVAENNMALLSRSDRKELFEVEEYLVDSIRQEANTISSALDGGGASVSDDMPLKNEE